MVATASHHTIWCHAGTPPNASPRTRNSAANAAHPGLDYPSYNNIGMTYDVQWFTLTSGHTAQDNLFGDQKFWRTKFLDAYKRHLPFKSLDSFVGNPSVNFQRILKHPTPDAYYDAMLPTREQL